jgi:hypothetical protein
MSSRNDSLNIRRLLGIIVAFVTALITWFATRDTISSFLTGIVTEVIALLLEIQGDIASTKNAVISTVSLSEKTSSHRPLRELVSDFDAVIIGADPLFATEAQHVIIEANETMAGLKRGCMRVRGPVAAYVKGVSVIKELRKGGIATAIVESPEDWSGGEINYYHKVNIERAKAGLKITRIFIVKDKSFLTSGSPLILAMKEQHDAGIEVRCALFKELERSLVRDVGLWDDQLVVTIEYSTAGALDVATYDKSPAVVKETREYLERVIMRSHPFVDFLKQMAST